MVRRRDDSPERAFMIRDRYQRLSKLGEGTYGKVYKAKDTETGAIVALKKCRLQVGFPSCELRWPQRPSAGGILAACSPSFSYGITVCVMMLSAVRY